MLPGMPASKEWDNGQGRETASWGGKDDKNGTKDGLVGKVSAMKA